MKGILLKRWCWHGPSSISAKVMHEILMVRQEVFILEQCCLYADIDKFDMTAQHLVGRDSKGYLIAYCRLIGPGEHYQEPAVGRVLVAKSFRGYGIARDLMRQAERRSEKLYQTRNIRLNAQSYLQAFYETLGYKYVKGPYDEDGISHVEMLKVD